MLVHHRVDGLENKLPRCIFKCDVHHRVDGLEKKNNNKQSKKTVHHRVDGLETQGAFEALTSISSPSCRWLRNTPPPKPR